MKNKNQTRSRFKSLQLLFFLLAMGTFRLSAYEDAKSAIAAADALESVHTIASMIMANKMNPENIISNLS